MIEIKKWDLVYRSFGSISELIDFIDHSEVQSKWDGKCISERRGWERTKFTGSKSLEEARKLLLDGWECGTSEFKKRVSATFACTRKQKSFYDVCGYSPCVPRYVMGLPDSMIRSKIVDDGKKVITINKSITYNCRMKTDEIYEEGAKVLNLVNELEREGYRVKLNILVCFYGRYEKRNMLKVCIKKAEQKLNLKQISFPLVHSSMLRRIYYSYVERVPECNNCTFLTSYGCPDNMKRYEDVLKGEVSIPPVVNEKEITDIDKYRM